MRMLTRTLALAALLSLPLAPPLVAQSPIVGVKPGTDSVSVTMTTITQPAVTLRKAVAVIVVFGQPVAIRLWREARIVNGARVLIPMDSLPINVGDVGCIYTTATSANGSEIPGIPTAPAIADSSMLAFRAQTGLTCPITTVLSSQIPVNPQFAAQTNPPAQAHPPSRRR